MMMYSYHNSEAPPSAPPSAGQTVTQTEPVALSAKTTWVNGITVERLMSLIFPLCKETSFTFDYCCEETLGC